MCGEPCAHAIALHGRGGFRTALPQQLQDMWDAYVAAGQPSDWEAPGLPGVMEAVAVSYDLSAAGAAAGAAGAAAGEQYALFSSEVALDDSCGMLEGRGWWGQAPLARHCFVSICAVEPAYISIDTYVLPQCTPPTPSTPYTPSHTPQTPSHTPFIVCASHTFSHLTYPTPVPRAAGGPGALQRAVGRQHRMAVWLD